MSQIAYRNSSLIVRLAALAAFALPATLAAQSPGSNEVGYHPGITASIGISNTPFPSYSNTAEGGSISLFIQPKLAVGAQIKASTYRRGARFRQSPVTAGYRFGLPHIKVAGSGVRRISTVIFLGGGVSRSQDATSLNQPTRAAWDPCLEGSVAFELPIRRITWRIGEFSIADTITPIHQLQTYSGNMGFTYHF